MYTVYKHTSPSGKYYIGITKQNVFKRWRGGKNYLRLNKDGTYRHKAFAAAILKYGWENFSHEIIIEGVAELTAKNMERDLILFAKRNNLSYNLTDGGDGLVGLVYTPEHRAAIGRTSLGRHHTDETKNLMRQKALGRKLSEETKAKIGAAQKFRTPESYYNLSRSKIGKPVEQYDLAGNYIQTFECARYAVLAVNGSRDNGYIKKCCLGLVNSAYGFKWKYTEIYNKS